MLQDFFSARPDVELILSPENCGYACGNNLGLKKAEALGLEYCLIANSDITILTSDFLEQLVAAAGNLPACGLVGPKIILPDGRPQGPLPVTGIYNGIFPTRLRQYERATSVYATVGCFIFGATETFKRIGRLDETTFLYREETILAEKLKQIELRWYYLPTVLVRHDHVRKNTSVRSVVAHKRFEAESTVYYFRKYKNRSKSSIFIYRLLLAGKVAIFVVGTAGVSMARRFLRRTTS